MPVDLDDILKRGGKPLLDLLAYCVYAARVEPVFLLLAEEYRLAPTAARALALHDTFCAPSAHARLDAPDVLEPLDLRLRQAVGPVRAAVARAAAPLPPPAEGEGPPPRPTAPLPAPTLFDHVVAHLRGLADGPLQAVASSYDPARTPFENLPGGTMSARQRFFVERVWRPRARPLLTAAGFWRMATIGG